MLSIHAERWIKNLKDTDHKIYWFDVLNRGSLDSNIVPIKRQFRNWQSRKTPYVKGEYAFSKKLPYLYSKIESILRVTVAEYLDYIIKNFEPDVIQSFEMQSCSYPILKTMNKHPNIKWIYSCWGSDLFYYSKSDFHRKNIKKILKRVDYIFTDCERDYKLAKFLNFNGKLLGILPGGSGYAINKLNLHKTNLTDRNIILVKGYEHDFGRALNVIKALQVIEKELCDYKIVVFAAHEIVIDYITNNQLNFTYYARKELSHTDLLKLMGKSLIHIGNSISDGIPNTLLEAIIMGAFPIQSNPGGATEEYLVDKKNGFLISNPDDINDISHLILKAINSFDLIISAEKMNSTLSKKRLDENNIRKTIINSYEKVFNDLEINIKN